MRFGIIVFPGTWSDRDCYHVLDKVFGQKVDYLWHKETDLSDDEITPEANPNGSLLNIAGIVSRQGNVLGMMPHPERCCEEVLGGTDGELIFESIISWLKHGNSTKDIKNFI